MPVCSDPPFLFRRPKGIDQNQDDIYGETETPVAVTVVQKTDEETRRETIRETDEPERLQDRYKHRPRPVAQSVRVLPFFKHPENYLSLSENYLFGNYLSLSLQILQEEATWLVNRLREYANSCSVPLERGAPLQGTRDGNISENPSFLPTFSMCDLFNESKQRQRYDDAFKGSGLAPREDDDAEKRPGGTGFAFFPPTKSLVSEITHRCCTAACDYWKSEIISLTFDSDSRDY